MLTLGLITVVIGLFYYYAVRPMSYWKTQGVKQTNCVWLFGNSLKFFFQRQSIGGMVQEVYNAYPDERYYGFYQFTSPSLLIKDPKLVKQITVKDFDHFTDHKLFIPDNTDEFWNRNLLSLKGQEWKDMRSVLSPSFTSNKMKLIFTLMNNCADNFIKFLKSKESDVNVEMKDFSSRFSNDIIATTAFGLNVNSLDEPQNGFYLNAKEMTDFTSVVKAMKIFLVMLFPKIHSLINFQVFYDPCRSFFADLITKNLRDREKNGIVRPDMLHLMAEARKNYMKQKNEESKRGKDNSNLLITDTDIIATSLVFIFAGFESVSSLITFMSYELAINPDIQKRVRMEIEEAFENSGEKFTYETLQQMKYLDMVISETLRKWPNFPSTDRICTKDYTIEPDIPGEKPFIIKKGTEIELPIIAFHYDPKHFPEPKRFDPERFSDENKDKIDPYTYFPFGLGQRNCVGNRFAIMEAKLFFCKVLISFEITPNSETVIPMKLSCTTFNTSSNDPVSLTLKPL